MASDSADHRRANARRPHRGDLRRALVEAALRLLDERGVEAVTVRELARRLGVSHAAPAHHFPDKLALLAAVAAEGYRRFAASLSAAVQDPSLPGQRLSRIGMAYLTFALEHPSTFRVMFGRELADRSLQFEELGQASRAAHAVLEEAVTDAVGVPSPLHAMAAWSLVHGAAMLYLDGPLRSWLPEEDPRGAFERAMSAILSGRAGPPAKRSGARARARRGRRRP